MQLKTLLYNRGIYIQNIRNIGWIGLGYFLCLAFAIPLQILMVVSINDRYNEFYEFSVTTLFRFYSLFQLTLMFTVPILLAILIFRYMQVKLSADFLHSLPIKREALFHQHFIFGLALLIIPVIAVALILFILGGFIDAPNILNITTIAKWAGTTILVNSFVYALTVFSGMFTGISLLQGAFAYLLMVLPTGLTVLVFFNIRYYLNGFAIDYYLSSQIEKLIPFVLVSDFMERSITGFEVFFILLFTFIFYLVALLVYKRRKVETATQPIAFKGLQPIFIYGITLCATLLGGMYFGETQGTLGWRIFGYVSASIIGYYVAIMIIKKTWRVFKRVKGYFIYSGVMTLIILFIQLDLFGFENRIPNIADVERVYFSDKIYNLIDEGKTNTDNSDLSVLHYYNEAENISNIIALHQDIVNKNFDQSNRYYYHAAIGYELKNGKKIVRMYQVPEQYFSKENEYYKKIVQTNEHKMNSNPLLRLSNSEIVDKITIVSAQGTKQVTITDRNDINSFHDILKDEVNQNPNINMNNVIAHDWGHIEYLLQDNQRLEINWKKSYSHIDAWLKEKGLMAEARLVASDVEYAVIVKMDQVISEGVSEGGDMYHIFQYELLELERIGEIINDPLMIEQCLYKSTMQELVDGYMIVYVLKGNHPPVYEYLLERP